MSKRLSENIVLGIVFGLINAAMLSFMGFFGKLLGSYYGPIEVTFFRNLFSIMPFVLWLILSGRLWLTMQTGRPFAHLFRSTIGTIGIVMGMWAFQLLPVTEAIVLFFTAPLFVLLLAGLLLRETIGLYRIGAVLVGFAGVFLVASPGGDITPLGFAVGIGYAFIAACVDVCLRWMGDTEKSETTVFYFLLFGLCATGAYWPFADNPQASLDLPVIGIMAGLGIAGVISLLSKTQSLRLAPASVIAPTLFTMILWGLLLDYMYWERIPGWPVLAGATLIIGSNLFITYRDSQKRRNKSPQTNDTSNTP